jgi:cytochrome c oxidase subunit IV
MRAYVAVTGLLFVLIVISHVVRAFVEKGVVHDVGFILLTLVLVILVCWAGVLLRKNPSPVGSNG